MEKRTVNIIIISIGIAVIVSLGGIFYLFFSEAIEHSSFSIEGTWSDDMEYLEFHSNGTFYRWHYWSSEKDTFGNYTVSSEGFQFKLTLEYYTDSIIWIEPGTEVFNLDFITVHTINGEWTRSIELNGWEYDYFGPVGSYNFSSA